MKKNSLIVLGIIVFLVVLLYSVAWFIAIPKTAEALVPYKWRSVNAGQKRTDYHFFIGMPSATDSTTNEDTWTSRRDHYEYLLRIRYDKDSVAKAFSISYHFNNILFNRESLITADSVP